MKRENGGDGKRKGREGRRKEGMREEWTEGG